MVAIVIKYDGVDITDDVLLENTWFESIADGRTGKANVRLRDKLHTYPPSFFAGVKTLELFIGGSREWDGWGFIVRRGWAFPVDDTTDPTTTPRFWTLGGLDRNILFTKRVLYDTNNPGGEGGLKIWPAGTSDREALDYALRNYVDLDGLGLDASSGIEQIASPADNAEFTLGFVSANLGVLFEDCQKVTGGVFYIDPDRVIRYVDDRTVTAPFVLSDNPSGAEVGYRDLDAGLDFNEGATEALVWGTGVGSANPVFEKYRDEDAVDAYGLWQWADIFIGAWKQSTVRKRARTYIDGSPSHRMGHKDPTPEVTFKIFEHGLRVAHVVDFNADVFGYQDDLPVRRIKMTFPSPTDVEYDVTLALRRDTPFGAPDLWPKDPFEEGREGGDPDIPDGSIGPDPGTGNLIDHFDRFFTYEAITELEAVTEVSLELPDGLSVGRTVLMFVRSTETSALTAIEDLQDLDGNPLFTSDQYAISQAYWRIIDGREGWSEDGQTIDVTSPSTDIASYAVVLDGVTEVESASSNSMDPPSLNPTWPTTDATLWYTSAGKDGATPITGDPDEYVNAYDKAAVGLNLRVSVKADTAATDDPTTYTSSGGTQGAITVALRYGGHPLIGPTPGPGITGAPWPGGNIWEVSPAGESWGIEDSHLFASGAGSVPAVASSESNANWGAASISVNKPSGTSDGDLLVAVVSGDEGGSSRDVTATGWTQVGYIYPSNHDQALYIFTKTASSEPTSWTFSWDSGTGSLAAAVLAIPDAEWGGYEENTGTAYIGERDTATAEVPVNSLVLAAHAGASFGPTVTWTLDGLTEDEDASSFFASIAIGHVAVPGGGEVGPYAATPSANEPTVNALMWVTYSGIPTVADRKQFTAYFGDQWFFNQADPVELQRETPWSPVSERWNSLLFRYKKDSWDSIPDRIDIEQSEGDNWRREDWIVLDEDHFELYQGPGFWNLQQNVSFKIKAGVYYLIRYMNRPGLLREHPPTTVDLGDEDMAYLLAQNEAAEYIMCTLEDTGDNVVIEPLTEFGTTYIKIWPEDEEEPEAWNLIVPEFRYCSYAQDPLHPDGPPCSYDPPYTYSGGDPTPITWGYNRLYWVLHKSRLDYVKGTGGPELETGNRVESGVYYLTTQEGTAGLYGTRYPYARGTLEVFLGGMRMRRNVDYFEVDPLEGQFTLSDDRDWSQAIRVRYEQYSDKVVTKPTNASGDTVYRPAPIQQLGWGTRLDAYNCTMACGCMALDRHTKGHFTAYEGNPKATPPIMRSYQDDQKGGAGLDDVATAWSRGWNQTLIYGISSWSWFVHQVDQGRGAILQGSYAALPDNKRFSDSFTGGHALYINERFSNGNFLGMDPLYRKPVIYTAAQLQAYASGLSWVGSGQVSAAYTQVSK